VQSTIYTAHVNTSPVSHSHEINRSIP